MTIIILLILAGITISQLTGNGIFQKAQLGAEKNNKETATEKINLKIMDAQLNSFEKKQQMPTLKELSEYLRDDEEIEYVTETSQIISKTSTTKYEVGDNPKTIYTKLSEYKYEFEIGEDLSILSIDNQKIKQIGSFEEMLKECGIEGYTIEEIAQNKDDSLNKIINNEKALQYIIENFEEYGQILTNTEISVNLLSSNEKSKNKVVLNTDWLNGMKNGAYSEIFDNNMKTIPIMTSSTEPSGEVIGNCWMNGYEPYKAFNEDENVWWYAPTSTPDDCIWANENHAYEDAVTLIYKYAEQKKIYKFSVLVSNITNGATNNNVTIWISPDVEGDNWTKVHEASWSWGRNLAFTNRLEQVNFDEIQTIRRIKIKASAHCTDGWDDSLAVRAVQAYGL